MPLHHPKHPPRTEAEELEHSLRNIALGLRYGLDDLQRVRLNEEQFNATTATMEQQLDRLKALIIEAAQMLEPKPVEVH